MSFKERFKKPFTTLKSENNSELEINQFPIKLADSSGDFLVILSNI